MSDCKHCGSEKEWVEIKLATKKLMCVNPDCKGVQVIDSVAGSGILFDKPKESSKWENFSYRAGYLKEQAQNDRRNAEAKSHMGSNPYPKMRD